MELEELRSLEPRVEPWISPLPGLAVEAIVLARGATDWLREGGFPPLQDWSIVVVAGPNTARNWVSPSGLYEGPLVPGGVPLAVPWGV